MLLGTLAAIWRYPVKSLRAEALPRVAIGASGLEGDRTAALIVTDPAHARSAQPFRGKESARLHLTADPEVAASYAADAGTAVALERDAGPVGGRWYDLGIVSLLLDLWVRDVEALAGESLDPLRWRPNLYATAAPGIALREAELVGRRVQTGDVVLDVVTVIRRCVTTTYDVATGRRDDTVLRAVAQHRANVVGVYAEVVRSGTAAVGDALVL